MLRLLKNVKDQLEKMKLFDDVRVNYSTPFNGCLCRRWNMFPALSACAE
jgi:hypothetical protein